MAVKRLLALVPRGVVHRVPRATRDRWRTRLLLLERLVRGQPLPKATQPMLEPRQPAATRAALAGLADRLGSVEQELRAVHRQVDEVLASLEQLDSRISTGSSGEAPRPVEDLSAIVAPLERLHQRLDELDVSTASSSPAPAPARAVGDGNA